LSRKRRVVVLGGGIAGLTAAHELSRTAEARADWETTIYEMGHKIGGRLFSAHDPRSWGRNEEHGLHVWFGFYDNAFRLAEEVWRDVRKPVGAPWKSIWDAVRPIHTSDHGLVQGDGYVVRRVVHARNSDRPGAVAEPLSIAGRLTGSLDLLRALPRTVRSLLFDHAPPAPDEQALWPAPSQASVLRDVLDRVASMASRSVDASHAEADTAAARRARVNAAARVERVLRRLHRPLVDRLVRMAKDGPGALELARVVDVFIAAGRGLSSERHGFFEDFDLDRISGWELGAWLIEHGADRTNIAESRLLEFAYDAPFAYLRGERERPVLEAGTAMRFLLRMLRGYKHAIAYLLAAGAGETIIAPLVVLLRDRGVRFRPFHRLEKVEIDPATRRVQRIVFVRAARVKGEYDPIVEHHGLYGLRAEPDWEQLEDGASLAARGVDFYSRFARDRGENERVVLEVDRDFDDVILALPLGAIVPDPDGFSPVENWLAFHPEARACFERLHLVPTVAAQLWFREPADAIGLEGRALVSWATPFSILCDMSPVIAHEGWPSPPPASCAYLCGAWPLDAAAARSTDHDAPARDRARAEAMLRAQLAGHAHSLLTPSATLHAPDGVEDPIAAQYVRVNVEPWDLADLSLPGADEVRLEATDSGLVNMALAGSWVRTSINTTSVEAAVSSGLAAARALGADCRPILAEDLLRRPSPRPVLAGRAPRRAQGGERVARDA
jgi:uncharacterized protein with NAD-binding domain and iron-sulfur cluster